MQSSLNLEQMLGDWRPNTGDDTSILGTQKISFLLHTCSGRISSHKTTEYYWTKKCTSSLTLVLVCFLYVKKILIYLFFHLKYLRTAVHFRSGQSSVSTVAKEKNIGK